MPIKVAHVCAIPTSIKYLLFDQLKYLEEERGYEVHAISSPGKYQEELIASGVRWHSAQISRSITPCEDIKGILEFAKLARRERFDIVHTHTPKGVMIGQIGAKLAGVPIIGQTIHGFYFIGLEPGLKRKLVRTIESSMCRLSDFVLSQSKDDVDRIKREKICAMDKTSVLGNGIDIRRFTPRTYSLEELALKRTAIGLNPKGPVLGIVGRYVIEKGYRELCEAVRMLAKKHPTLQVLAIGSSPGEERSIEIVRPDLDPEVGDRFVCLYDRDDMEELYRLMDIFVLPSYREGFPRSPMEASATGLPVIATRIRGCWEAVHEGDNGLLVHPRQAQPLADAIELLLNDEVLRKRLGKRGIVHAKERFDQRLVFARVAECYEQLLRH